MVPVTWLVAHLGDGFSSTYICPIVTDAARRATLAQLAVTVLDVALLRGLHYFAMAWKHCTHRTTTAHGQWAPIFLGAAIFEIGIHVRTASSVSIAVRLNMSGVALLGIFVSSSHAALTRTLQGSSTYPNVSKSHASLTLALLYLAGWMQTQLINQKLAGLVTLPWNGRRRLVRRIAIASSFALLTFLVMGGFDAWYEYAINRSSVIVDTYDQIYNDLLPFATIPPATLRQLTSEMISEPWNDVAAIHIRNGEARLQDGIKPTHVWMVSGVKDMIDNFAEYLPDMDIPLNINDEPRIAVPWGQVHNAKQHGLRWRVSPSNLTAQWSSKWDVPPTRMPGQAMFSYQGRSAIFSTVLRQTCPPDTPVSKGWIVNDKRHVCLSCIRRHSLGQFLSRWTVAGDICHQPDLAYLHGFFASPNDLKTTWRLLPVFSQSRVAGFSDILYPSAWNYVDKVAYHEQDDMRWASKRSVLFWRGMTTEGYAQGSNWAGFLRQRLVHMANNGTAAMSVLLSSGTDRGTVYRYMTLADAALADRLQADLSIHFTGQIHQAHEVDGALQTQEFHVVEPVDFGVHWANRYLLDTDGAAFSGRFLPFLQSRSLPLRTGLFRTWLDERLTAWAHFVPIDVRLHGLWSTLAYFVGVRGAGAGTGLHGADGMGMRAHDREARQIADQGRIWARQALRKEDMEIYMFRLLLEWARLTDDNREHLGFVLPGFA
ncbi:hypothetical protein KEM52_005888 [Ascosphaera acerosa]|nr:hypothetical protein KEM52_005888 [Ascosphaera acerosa]